MVPGGWRSLVATRGSWAVPVFVVVLVLVALWYGHAPPRSVTAYQTRAADTAGFLHSQLETARLWARERPDGVFDTSVVVGIEESATDAGVTLDRFAGYDPPPGAQRLRARVTDLGHEARSLLEGMRIAAHRGDWGRVGSLARQAERPSRDLERLSARVRPR